MMTDRTIKSGRMKKAPLRESIYVEKLAGSDELPFELTKVKNYLGINDDFEDEVLKDFIKSSVAQIQEQFKVVVLDSKVHVEIQNPAENFLLPYSPIYIDQITVVDEDDKSVEHDIFGNKYGVRVSLEDYAADHIFIEYTAGFGSTATAFNDPIWDIVRQGLYQMVGTFHADRENNAMSSVVEIPSSTEKLLKKALRARTPKV